MTDLDHCIEQLHALHGNRICLVQQSLKDGDVRDALRKQGEGRAFALAISLLKDAQDGTYPQDTDGHYADLSKARFAAEEQHREPTETDTSLRGLQ